MSNQIDQAERKAKRLEDAIRKHRDQKGDDRCWLDDRELYESAGLAPAEMSLPPRGEFLASCERYWCQRQSPEDRSKPPGKTIGQLEREVVELNRALDALIVAMFCGDWYAQLPSGEIVYSESRAGLIRAIANRSSA